MRSSWSWSDGPARRTPPDVNGDALVALFDVSEEPGTDDAEPDGFATVTTLLSASFDTDVGSTVPAGGAAVFRTDTGPALVSLATAVGSGVPAGGDAVFSTHTVRLLVSFDTTLGSAVPAGGAAG